MEKVTVELGDRGYSIFIGSGNLDAVGKAAAETGFGPKCAVVSNPTVFGLYGGRVMDSLKKEGFDVSEILIPDGEQYKDFMWVYYILTELLKRRLDRKSVVIALGGGVIGDIACFAASTYMRGIACVQVPTTLLSQVDSSVGGKTGVNHYFGKNMIGTFYQPALVWMDVETLKTLPEREVLAGIAEVIKYGVIRDPDLFGYLSDHRDDIVNLDPEKVSHIIRRSCEIKAAVVSEDERESGLRAVLNFGHTIGHAVETLTGYVKYLHGEAVAIGMCYEAELSRIMGLTDGRTVGNIRDIVKRYGLPLDMPEGIDPRSIVDAVRLDKKAVAGKPGFVLTENIGKVRIEKDVKADHIYEALQFRP